MSWFQDTFSLQNIKNFYNSAKETVQSIYSPIKSVVNTITSGAATVNDWINKAKEIPLVRDLVSDIISPVWEAGYSALRDVNDGVNYGGEIGSAVDKVISGALG